MLVLDEFGVGELVGGDERLHRVPEEERILPVVESERELVQVGRKVLDAHLMIRTDNASLEEAPDALYGVCVNITADPFVVRMRHRLVFGVLVTDPRVAASTIRLDGLSVVMDGFGHELVENLLGRGAVRFNSDSEHMLGSASVHECS